MQSMGFIKRIVNRLNEVDQIVAIILMFLGIIIVVLSFILGYFKGMALTSAIIFGALFYLLLKNKLTTSVPSTLFQLGTQIRPISHIVFIISLSAMILIMWSDLYNRPPMFFYMIVVAAASIILDIFSLDEMKKSHILIALFKIIVLSMTVYLSIYHEFPGIWGVDAWWHNGWTQETIDLGHITRGEHGTNDYFLFPLFHISSAIMQIVTQVSTYNAIFIGTGAMIALTSIFLFLVGEKLVSVKVGLIAALIFPLTDQAIARSINIISMSLAFCFFPAIIYLALNRDKKGTSDTMLLILFSVALIFSHTIAALVMLLSLSVIYVSLKIINKTGKLVISHSPVSLTFIAFFWLLMLFRWMQPTLGEKSFFDVNLNNIVQSLQSEAQFVMLGVSPTRAIAPMATVFDDSGYILLLVFGIIGALTLLHRRNRNSVVMVLVSLAASLVFVPQMLSIFSILTLLPDRWFIFSFVVLTLVAATGIFRVGSIIPQKIGKIITISLITIATVFVMTINSNANTDSPMFFNGSSRTGYTQSELNSVYTLCRIGGGRPVTDNYFGRTFPYIVGFDRYEDLLQQTSRVFIKRNYYLQHPEWNRYYVASIISIGPEVVTTGREMVSDYMHIWGIDYWPIIYQNNNVTVFSSAAPAALQ